MAIKELREEFDKKFISITDEGIKEALNKNGDVFVMATKATCKNHAYKKIIEGRSSKKVYEESCPKLVDYIEEGILSGEKIDSQLKDYLTIANEKKIENIILGCTHYPIIKKP